MLHHVKPLLYGRHIFKRKGYPTLEQAAAHGRCRAINGVGKCTGILVERAKKFEVARCESVNPYVFILVDSRYGSNVIDV